LLRARVLSALVLIPIAALIIWAGGWWFFAAIGLVALLAGYEFSQLMRQGGYAPATIFVLAIICVSLIPAQFPTLDIVQPALTALLILSISWQLFQARDEIPTTNWALTIAGGLYVGWLSANAIRLRGLPPNSVGLAWMVLALLVTWGGDTAAYFVGRTIGRHKFWPRLSPRKTWEGVLAGTIGCLLIGALVGYLAMRLTGAIGPFHGLIVGLLASIVGPLGDLAISMMKRQVKVKDSGQIIPGHGGVLDRTDSLLFIIATTYYYAIWFGS
jgi:phosphatidate cytidylyltransferase